MRKGDFIPTELSEYLTEYKKLLVERNLDEETFEQLRKVVQKIYWFG